MDFREVLCAIEDGDRAISVLLLPPTGAKCHLTSAAVNHFHHQMSLDSTHKVPLKVVKLKVVKN